MRGAARHRARVPPGPGATVGYPAASTACTGGALPAAVYRFPVTLGERVTIEADDTDGAPISFSLRNDSCAGSTTSCYASADGHADQSGRDFELVGTWVLIVARDARGAIHHLAPARLSVGRDARGALAYWMIVEQSPTSDESNWIDQSNR